MSAVNRASPLITVYLPTRNRLALLRRAIGSVLAQTWSSFELIVVDDGSADGTASYLERVAAADPRVRVIRIDESRGAPRARNLAIQAARGEFITGLDDDDSFHAGRLAALLESWQKLTERGAQFSCLYTQDVAVRGERRSVTSKPALVTASDLFFYNSIGNQVFTRRDYLIEVGMYDEQMPAWQDLDVFMRLLSRHGPALLVDRPLYMLDLEPRSDRISSGSKQRIVSAYRRLVAKTATAPASSRQALYLQIFGRLYGFRLELADLREFLRHGLHARTLRILGGVLLRQVTGGR